jgi:hypothetical protein
MGGMIDQTMGWKSGMRFPARARDFHLLDIFQAGSVSHQSSSSRDSWRYARKGFKQATRLHLVSRLRVTEFYFIYNTPS